MSNHLGNLSGPAGRTNFLRVTLNFQGIQDLGRKRQLQTRVLDKLKHLKSKSGIEGQDNCHLWVTKDRSIEERIRIRALVLTKNFYEKLPQPSEPAPCRPPPEIVWRGQVFVGQRRMLKCMDNGHEPTANDQIVEVTGKPKEALQQMWADYGPDATPFGSAIGIPTSWLGKAYVSFLHQFICPTNFVRRYHDEIAFCCDLNYDILDIVNVDERGVPLGQLLRSLGLEFTRLHEPTWSNTSGACSRIDFILFSLQSMTFWDDRVLLGSDAIVGSDHCAISVSLQSLTSIGRGAFQNSKCGKWWTQGPQLMNKASALAEHLELSMSDMCMEDLSSLCQSCSRRVTSCRFVDTPDIKALIAKRKRLRGREARELAKQIADTRRQAKKEWLASLLQKSAEGDFRAIAYFKKRNTAMYTQGSYCIRAGGRSKAIADLRFFYQRKHTPPDPMPPGLPRAIFHARAPIQPILNPLPFTLEEIRDVAFMCKHNKSTGADGISYEALQMLLQSELAEHILDMYNGVFTKALMLRLRPKLPSIGAFQVGGVPQRQILDAACAVQQAIRLSEQYGKPLVIIKLDVAAAFDSLSHASIASFLAQAQGSREAEVLLDVICNSCVGLGLQGTSWDQPLRQGVLQGSSYSAELFARCVDFYMSFINQEWQQREETWLQTQEGRKLFLTPFADDLVLIATSRDQAVRLLEDTVRTLGAIGLRMNWRKCKYIQTPGLPKIPMTPCGTDIQWAQSFIFLGILMGFQLSCQAVLAARMTKIFDVFITSRWRWLSPAVRVLGFLDSKKESQQTGRPIGRYPPQSFIPIAVTLRIKGPEWLFANGSCNARGNRAADREVWKHFSADWSYKNDALATRFYSQSPEEVDLRGCQLLQNGDFFSLLHTRHPPVEEPYTTSFVCLNTPSCDAQTEGESENVLRVFSDGSAPNNRKGQAGTGGGAVVVLSFVSSRACPYTGAASRGGGQGTLLLTAVIGVTVMVLFGWGALTSFLRSLVTTMQGAEMQHSLTTRMEKTTETLVSQVHDIQAAIKGLADAPRESLDAHAFGEELWDSLRPVLAQWSQVQGDKTLKILQDWIDGAAPTTSTSSVSTQVLENKMKDFHAAVMAQLQDLQGAVTTTTLNKVDNLNTKVEAVAAETKTMAGYMREDHALIVRIKDRVEEVSKESLSHRSAVLAEIKNVCEDTAKTLLWVSGQETELKDRTHKIESMLTGMLDVVNDVGTALE
ncbi:pol, partial [Symbiodinium necroappetens]